MGVYFYENNNNGSFQSQHFLPKEVIQPNFSYIIIFLRRGVSLEPRRLALVFIVGWCVDFDQGLINI